LALEEVYWVKLPAACRLMTVAASSLPLWEERTGEPPRTRLVELAREKSSFAYRGTHVSPGD